MHESGLPSRKKNKHHLQERHMRGKVQYHHVSGDNASEGPFYRMLSLVFLAISLVFWPIVFKDVLPYGCHHQNVSQPHVSNAGMTAYQSTCDWIGIHRACADGSPDLGYQFSDLQLSFNQPAERSARTALSILRRCNAFVVFIPRRSTTAACTTHTKHDAVTTCRSWTQVTG